MPEFATLKGEEKARGTEKVYEVAIKLEKGQMTLFGSVTYNGDGTIGVLARKIIRDGREELPKKETLYTIDNIFKAVWWEDRIGTNLVPIISYEKPKEVRMAPAEGFIVERK